MVEVQFNNYGYRASMGTEVFESNKERIKTVGTEIKRELEKIEVKNESLLTK